MNDECNDFGGLAERAEDENAMEAVRRSLEPLQVSAAHERLRIVYIEGAQRALSSGDYDDAAKFVAAAKAHDDARKLLVLRNWIEETP